MDILKLDPKYGDLILAYGPKILIAIVFFFVGLWVIKKLTAASDTGMTRSGIDPDLKPFLVSLLNVLMKVALVLVVANIVGIETTSFVAILASIAFAVGLALQGTLSNFAAGVMILIFKPYRVGDLVDVQGVNGKVKEIGIFNTTIITDQEKINIIPNGKAIDGIISNYTTEKLVKTEIEIPIRYNADYEQIEEIITKTAQNTEGVLAELQIEVKLSKYEQDGFLIMVHAPVKAEHLAEVSDELRKNIYITLTRAGIKLGAKKSKEK